jgi:hypothetical protein
LHTARLRCIITGIEIMTKSNKLSEEVIIGGRKITKTKNNALDLDPDVILSLLASGRRDPQNEQERIWLKSIEETKAKGKGIDIPFN